MTSDAVVVGHDGSKFADRAVRTALSWAEKGGLPVRILRSWSLTSAPRPESMKDGYVPPLGDFADAVRRDLEADVAALVAEHPEVEVSYETPHKPAAQALIEASEEAALLVVGTRGRGGFKGLLLGSATEQCVRHADCPVLVVRGRHGDDDLDEADAERTVRLDAAFDDGS
jgi:nucleotide-binding universal stress UspA family protein